MIGHRPKSIVDVVFERSASDGLAYVFLADGTSESEVRWTFSDTANKSRAFAAHLRDRGIGAGDRVVLAVNPSLEYIAALYGIMSLGAVPVPCFPPLRAKELDRFHAIAVDCTPKGILIDEMYREPIEALQVRLQSSNLEPLVFYTEHVPSAADESDSVSTTLSDIALIQYTSGSTGAPKGVCLTHDNLVSNCEALGRNMGDDPARIGFSWLPPYHDMGLMGTIFISMFQGVPLVLMSPMHFVQEPFRWLKALSDYRVSITVGPNFSLDMCSDALDAREVQDLDLSTVERLYCGAEPISADTLERFLKAVEPLGFDQEALTPCYGMAEATLYVSGKAGGTSYRAGSSPEPSGTDRPVVSCGEVDSDHVVRIVDPASLNRLDDGQVGEIWVSGPSVAAGYYDRPEQNRLVFQAKLADEERAYLRTGDLGFLRAGELFVTGRIKDLVIVNGRNIYPQDVEGAVVRASSEFRLAVAFSIPDKSSEQLCIVAETGHREVTTELHSTMLEAIRSSIISEFGIRPHIHLAPRRTIPTTTSGKVRRQETRRMFLANELRSVHVDAIQECTA
ncbi:fatty acyl-AMP ligase [Mycobacterium sp. 2YAF39]|uniref:fatty acyl-AMP ligase n=1 Tax=Mycobacterium sp. 2YAF39 TaxID=3233033 RepID=UPI003F9E54D4